ncbi:MAG: protein translocase subunit SecF [Firmicutes bacterium]|jgi:preprotein translocase SecF subunit|nr:protein translocase subunit SecF [Bacillota bacterium]
MRIAERFKLWALISAVVIVLGLGIAMVKGFNLGIDFTGGTMLQVDMGRTYTVEEVKNSISEFDLSPEIIEVGAEKQEVLIKTTKPLDNKERMVIFNKMKSDFSLADDALRAQDQFGSTVGKEMQKKAFLSVALASIGMLIYITLRFEITFGISSIIALVHDVLILLAVYAIFRIPVNSSFIAAVLTIVGYSINDTIVVFDRVRENVKFMKKADYIKVANDSIGQTLHRSINTSLTTALVIGSLYVLGIDSIKEFALPLLAGVLVGTYSSIFIASPLWATIKQSRHNKNRKYAG